MSKRCRTENLILLLSVKWEKNGKTKDLRARPESRSCFRGSSFVSYVGLSYLVAIGLLRIFFYNFRSVLCLFSLNVTYFVVNFPFRAFFFFFFLG